MSGDDRIRALIRSVAQSTVEYLHDEYGCEQLWAARHEIAAEVVEFTMACADDEDGGPVNDLREVGHG